jgi:hypothetical protein
MSATMRLSRQPDCENSAVKHRIEKFGSGRSALNQSHNQHDHRDHKEEVDQRSSHMAYQSEQPEHQQNDKNCPKHEIRQLISKLLFALHH